MDEGQKAKFLYIRLGAHDKDEPEIEARVKKIDVPSTWDMDEDFGWNVSDGPDAAVSRDVRKMSHVTKVFNSSNSKGHIVRIGISVFSTFWPR